MRLFGLEVRLSRKIKLPFQSDFARLGGIGRRAARSVRKLVRSRPSTESKPVFEVRGIQDGWMIMERGAKFPLRMFVKKQEAIREARRMARERHSALEVFNREGDLQGSFSFS